MFIVYWWPLLATLTLQWHGGEGGGNYRDLTKLDHVCNMLEHGAKLGVEAEGRWPSFEPNSKSIMEYGDRVADSLQTGILDGYIAGPFTKEEVDKIWPEGYKVSPIMVRLKPTGQARII